MDPCMERKGIVWRDWPPYKAPKEEHRGYEGWIVKKTINLQSAGS